MLEGRASFRAVTAGLVVAKLALHLAVLGRWDLHRDELYFIVCARNPAFGYVDHPPMIAWVTALFGAPFGYDVHALRLAPAFAGAAAVALTCALVREMGGGARAALLAGTCLLAGPVFLRSGSLLCIPVFEPMLWSAAALFAIRLGRRAAPRAWLALGAIVGLGMMTKHAMVMWVAGLVLGSLFTPLRAAWRTRWPWLAGLVALTVFAPNAIWQATHDFATVEFLRTMSRGVLSEISRGLFLAGVLLYTNPLTVIVSGLGLRETLRRVELRVVGAAFLFSLAVLLVTRGKPYYVAGAFPALFAAGAVSIERAWQGVRERRLIYSAGVVALSGVPFALVSLPIVPVEALDRHLDPFVGSVTAPRNLTGELHDEFGWREQARTIVEVARGLDDKDRSRAVVLAANYGQASAVEVLARSAGDSWVPPPVSGHMAWFHWGVPEGRGDVAIVIGVREDVIRSLYRDVREVARTPSAPAAWPSEQELPVWLCRDPVVPLKDAWPKLKRFGHSQSFQATP